MRYTAEIEDAILAQIRATPERPVVLPDWAYWNGKNTPYVYVDGKPTPLPRRLYRIAVGPLNPGHGLANPAGVPARNVNPLVMKRMLTRSAKAECPNGHEYTDEDYAPGKGYRCRTCAAERPQQSRRQPRTGGPNPVEVNRAKTVCPQGHTLVMRPNGRRRCYECPRARQAAYRARQKEKQ